MDNLQKIAMLIDADNTQIGKLEDVIMEISTRGRIVVKKAYGNWKKDILKNWEPEIKRLAINAVQQFDYVQGKNATDMALVIDTMDLLYKDLYDAFVIVSSDSDYTPLAIRLHESGVYVIGVGEKKTPTAFRNACDEFVFLENIGVVPEPETKKTTKKKTSAKVKAEAEKQEAAKPAEKREVEPVPQEVHDLLRYAYEAFGDNDYVNLSISGAYLKRAMPEFDSRTYGFKKLPLLLDSFPELYEVKRTTVKSTLVIEYRCLD